MGGIRKQRRKYSKPAHPWQKLRIEQEKALVETYGLKNKKEIWRMASMLKGFARQAKSLIASTSPQGQREKEQLAAKVYSLSLLPQNASLDDVLGLSLKDLLERRLQTLVLRKKLANTISQARQFIVHGHIKIGDKKVTVPSYLVKRDEEELISMMPNSPILAQEETAGTGTPEGEAQ
jgi:small subunit ribosomal protein S4